MSKLLFRIQLYDQLLLDVLGDLVALGHVNQLATLHALVPLNPGILAVVETSEVVLDHLEALALLAHCDELAGSHVIAGDVNHLTVHSDVTVQHELACSSTCGSDAETVNNVVETALEQLQQHLAGYALERACLLEEVAELTLEHTIGVLSLLFFAKLCAILREFATAVLTVLTGSIVPASEHLVFTEDGLTELACDFRFWTGVSAIV